MQKNRKCSLKERIRRNRVFEIACIMGLALWIMMQIITAKAEIDYGGIPMMVSINLAVVFYICLRIFPIKDELTLPLIYRGEFKELLVELAETGFRLKDKIGDIYVFSTEYYQVSQLKVYAKDHGTECWLYGLSPEDSVKLAISQRGN